MRKQQSGRIINVSSVAGKLGIPFAAPYCASKHALEAMSDALRVEVAPFGIRVVLVEPGPVETRFGERARSGVASLLSRPGPYRELYKLAERAMDVDFQRGNLPAEAVAKVIVEAIRVRAPARRATRSGSWRGPTSPCGARCPTGGSTPRCAGPCACRTRPRRPG